MIARKVAGSIVNVSSQAGVVGLDKHVAYCASKGGMDQLTRTMALELGPHNIRVNSVNPTVVLTELGKEGTASSKSRKIPIVNFRAQRSSLSIRFKKLAWGKPEIGEPMKAKIPLGRFAEPHEIAEPVMYVLFPYDIKLTLGRFLLSPQASMITGVVLPIDGGFLSSR